MNIENRKNKKVIRFIKSANEVKLMNELYEALPELKPELENGNLTVNLRVFTREDELILWVPSEIDETVVEAVVDKHQIYQLLPQEDEEQISEFHYDSDNNEILIYTLRGSEIKFGNLERLEEKVALINQVFQIEEKLEEEGTGVLQYIDLRFAGQPALQIK
jgi:hypothetical protein